MKNKKLMNIVLVLAFVTAFFDMQLAAQSEGSMKESVKSTLSFTTAATKFAALSYPKQIAIIGVIKAVKLVAMGAAATYFYGSQPAKEEVKNSNTTPSPDNGVQTCLTQEQYFNQCLSNWEIAKHHVKIGLGAVVVTALGYAGYKLYSNYQAAQKTLKNKQQEIAPVVQKTAEPVIQAVKAVAKKDAQRGVRIVADRRLSVA